MNPQAVNEAPTPQKGQWKRQGGRFLPRISRIEEDKKPVHWVVVAEALPMNDCRRLGAWSPLLHDDSKVVAP